MILSALLLISQFTLTVAQQTNNEAVRLLPDRIEAYAASGPVETPDLKQTTVYVKTLANAQRSYRDGDAGYQISVVRTETDAAAFALLTSRGEGKEIKPGLIGTAGIETTFGVSFYKGSWFVDVNGGDKPVGDQQKIQRIAGAFAKTLPSADDDIPVLVKHLPSWESVGKHASYAVTSAGLKSVVPSQPILDAVDFDGGSEAVTAKYGQSQLVIVEFTTPQFSVDNDSRIWTKIAELKSQGQPTPSAYRRVGNYSVFVFNAADEKSANALIDQVKYEQVVQWLGDDPHLYEKLQRYFTQTSAGVLVAVLKSSGLSLLFCLAAGALIGTMLFRRRRAQRAEAFSDAGGSVRLNLDDLTGAANTQPLLTGGNPSRSDSTTR